MKRLHLYFFVALFAFTVGIFASLMRSLRSINSQTAEITAAPLDYPCAQDAFTVKKQPEATAQLVIVDASCNGPSWKARLTLQNIGSKALRGYEVGNIEAYEHKKDVKSSQGVRSDGGVELAPGLSKSLNFGGGFVNGLSCGKPVGSIQGNVFWIKRLYYTDGTSWQENEQKR